MQAVAEVTVLVSRARRDDRPAGRGLPPERSPGPRTGQRLGPGREPSGRRDHGGHRSDGPAGQAHAQPSRILLPVVAPPSTTNSQPVEYVASVAMKSAVAATSSGVP